MESNDQSVSSAADAQSGASAASGEVKKAVSFEDHQRALSDLQKYKSQLKEVSSKVEEVEKARLKEREDYKTLYEQANAKALELEKKHIEFQTEREKEARRQAVATQLLKAGLRNEEDIDLLTFDGVVVEKTDQGRMLVHGVDEYVSTLKKKKPYWFQDQSAPNINTGGTRKSEPPVSSLTPQEFIKKELEYKNDPVKLRELYKAGIRKA